ncbi:MAG: 50S ribosomal protein L21 [Bacteroidales bacterium]|nr:50S ribosomal protein L21 [Bacteroidales bacterium]
MYAIVEIAGKQFKVAQDQKIFVNRLKNDEGSEVSFDTVMLKDSDGNVEIGKPYIAGASVKATVLRHLKGDKVLVFKKIRRKGYQKMNGHRDYLTQIKIDSIN